MNEKKKLMLAYSFLLCYYKLVYIENLFRDNEDPRDYYFDFLVEMKTLNLSFIKNNYKNIENRYVRGDNDKTIFELDLYNLPKDLEKRLLSKRNKRLLRKYS